MLVQPRRALAAARAMRPEVVHVHDPELLRVAGRLDGRGVRAIYDAHEDLPRQILNKAWIAPALRGGVSRAVEAVEARLVRGLSGVVAATPHIERRFSRIHPSTVCVGNFPLLEELAPPAGAVPARTRAITYVGNVTRIRGARELVRAMEAMPGVTLILCGTMEDAALEEELRAMPGWSQVEYRGHVGRAELGPVMARASVGMVTLLPTPSYLDSLPTKMFEYMSAQLPVVASDFPLWRSILGAHRCGVCVDPADPRAIAGAVLAILDHPERGAAMGAAGRRAVDTVFNWPHEAAKLVAFYAGLLEGSRPARAAGHVPVPGAPPSPGRRPSPETSLDEEP
jgi:hypothetical protein